MENIEQIYTNCLAQGAYFIESNGEAAVIDPLRETEPYIRRAQQRGVKIKYIFETHFHADFVSGHVDLAAKTGATIVYGPTADTDYDSHIAKDGEEFKIGNIRLKVLHTPGHTPESSCFLLFDEDGSEKAVFTGDTLFIGDVGRPDLAQKATGLSQEDLAGWLFDSLRNKIMPLPDHVMIYPAHGAGSACGKNMSSETYDTLGSQKAKNYALDTAMSREEFIKELTTGLAAPPQYFSLNAALNKKGYESLDEVYKQGLVAHDVEHFEEIILQDDVLLLDVRNRWDFVEGFIPGSMFIGLDGGFAPWVGALVSDLKTKIALVVPEGKEEEAVKRLARVGYDNTVGYLKGGMEAWKSAGKEVARLDSISVDEFVEDFADITAEVIDVRKPSEYDTTHIKGSHRLSLDDFPLDLGSPLNMSNDYILHCRSGYRSTIASSLLLSWGFENITNVIGSFDKIKETLPVEGECPSLVS